MKEDDEQRARRDAELAEFHKAQHEIKKIAKEKGAEKAGEFADKIKQIHKENQAGLSVGGELAEDRFAEARNLFNPGKAKGAREQTNQLVITGGGIAQVLGKGNNWSVFVPAQPAPGLNGNNVVVTGNLNGSLASGVALFSSGPDVIP